MGAVKRKLEMIDDFAARFEGGLLTADGLSRYVVSTVDPTDCDLVLSWSVSVIRFGGSFQAYWVAVIWSHDNEITGTAHLGRFPDAESDAEEEHLACVEALFAVPGIIIEID